MAIISITKLCLTLVALLLARPIYRLSTASVRERALERKHGCLPPKKWQLSSYLLGFDWVLANFKAFKEYRLLEWYKRGLTDRGAHMLRVPAIGGSLHLTDEPDNIKCILSTSFNDWGIGKERIKHMSAYVGTGIFTAEGAAWKHSRDMLRPCFERSQVADISILEKHTDRLIEAIPKDGTTVDLQPFFQDFTLDVATEFLFGQSTNELDPKADHGEVDRFIKAFDYCHNPFEDEKNKKWGLAMAFLPDRTFKRHVKTINGTYLQLVTTGTIMHLFFCSSSNPLDRSPNPPSRTPYRQLRNISVSAVELDSTLSCVRVSVPVYPALGFTARTSLPLSLFQRPVHKYRPLHYIQGRPQVLNASFSSKLPPTCNAH
jgi:hypothetical protein